MKRGLALAAAFLPGTCVWDRSVFSPASPDAHRLAQLGWPILIGFLLVAVVVWALLAWIALRRTGTLVEHARADIGGGEGWIWIGGMALPALAFGLVFGMTLSALHATPMPQRDQPAELRITGHQWWWQVESRMGDSTEWFATANEFHIPVGRPVDVELRTADVIHSLWVPRLQGKVDLVPGHVNHILLQADKPGRYPGSCAELCGLQHAHMRLVVVADEPKDFAIWLENQRKAGVQPTAPEAQLGQKLFTERACMLCHTVRGTDAHGTFGPDLTHLASRHTIAAGSLDNDVANLHAWIVNAQSLKPGNRMPVLTEFSGPELRALGAYLRSLE